MTSASAGEKTAVVGLLGLLAAVGFAVVLAAAGPVAALAGAGALFILGASFFSMEVGVATLLGAMLFSPEIPVAATFTRPVTIRLEDVLLPLLCLAWLARAAVGKEGAKIERSALDVPIILFVAVCVVSTLRGMGRGYVDGLSGFFYTLKLVQFFLIYYVAYNFSRVRRDVGWVVVAALLVAALVALYGLREVPYTQALSERRITAPFEGEPEPGTVGGYFMMLSLVMIPLGMFEKRPRVKAFVWLIFVLVLVPFLYTFSRTSYAAFAGGLAALCLITRNRALIVLTLIAAAAAPIVLPSAVIDRVIYTLNPSGMGIDPSALERIYVWRKALYALRHEPAIGFGVTAFQILDSQFARFVVEVGLLGTGLFVWMLARVARGSWILYSRSEEPLWKALGAGFLAALVGLIVHSLGANTFYIVRIMEPFWFTAGVVLARASFLEEKV